MPDTKIKETKAELAAMVADRDERIVAMRAQLDSAYAHVDRLTSEAASRAETLLALEGAIQNASSAAYEQQALRIEAEQLRDEDEVINELAQKVLIEEANGIFNALHFAVQTLASISSYQGANPVVPGDIASVVVGELLPVVEAGIESGMDTCEGFADHVVEVLQKVFASAEETDSTDSETNTCGCGGVC